MRATGARTFLASAFALIALQACAQFQNESGKVQQASKTDNDEGAAAVDPIAAFARNGSTGSMQRINFKGQQYKVELGKFYKSAADTECRRITLGTRGESQASAVCKVDGKWETVLTRP